MTLDTKDADGKTSSFECCEGSHVFFSNGNGDYYSEWDGLTEELQEKFIKLKQTLNNTLNTLNIELSQVLLPLA